MARNISLADLHIALHRASQIEGVTLMDLRPAADLRRAAMTLSRCNELACNGIQRYDYKARGWFASWTDEDEVRNEKAINKARDKARKALSEIFGDNWYESFDLEFQADPRGAAIKLHQKGISSCPVAAVY